MDDNCLARIKKLITRETGVFVREENIESLRKLITGRMESLKLSDPESYCQLLMGSNERSLHERERLTTLLTTGETYFFRDSGQIALLQNHILPELIERKKSVRSLRIWSAGCSSGEEPYSLAILIDELLPERAAWNVLILGTDINPQVIEKARQGKYTQWSFRTPDRERQQRYFKRSQDGWMLDETIRGMVTFRVSNLLADAPPATDMRDMDLILCRNVFIYMCPAIVSKITHKFTDALAEGGYLMTGHSELYAHHFDRLQTKLYAESIVYQKGLFVPPPLVLSEVKPPIQAAINSGRAGLKQDDLGSASRKSPGAAHRQTPATPLADTAKVLQHAWAHANNGQWDEAAKLCRVVIATDALIVGPYYLLALLAQENGDMDEARKMLNKVLYLAPDSVAAYLELAILHERENETGMARKLRTAAHDVLQSLPPEAPVDYFPDVTVKVLTQFVDNLLDSKE